MPSPIVRRIAEEVGVSPRTVERALLGELKDTRPTIVARNRRIKALARELGYRPNAAARAVATGRFGCVALVVLPEQELLPARMVRRICDRLQEVLDADLKLVMLEPETLGDAEVRLPRVLRELSVDGLLVAPSAQTYADSARLAAERDLPVVWLNIRLERDAVLPDEVAAARRATERLIAAGRRRIAYGETFWQLPAHFSRDARMAGYEAAMREAGLQPRIETVRLGYADLRPQPDDLRERHWRRVLAADDRPDAVVCQELHIAGAVQAAAMLEGIAIGEDLAITSFAANRPSDLTRPLEVLTVPFREMGERAVDLLAEKLETGASKPSVLVPYADEGVFQG